MDEAGHRLIPSGHATLPTPTTPDAALPCCSPTGEVGTLQSAPLKPSSHMHAVALLWHLPWPLHFDAAQLHIFEAFSEQRLQRSLEVPSSHY